MSKCFLFLVTFTIISCGSASTEKAFYDLNLSESEPNVYSDFSRDSVIRVNIDFNDDETLSSSFFQDVSYLPLESLGESLFSEISQLEQTENRLIVLDKKTRGVFVFDERGAFLFKILSIGDGPKEYRVPKAISYNMFDNTIEVLDNTRLIIQKYSAENGQFISSLMVGFGVKSFKAIDATTYVFIVDSYQFNDNRYAQVKGLEKQILVGELTDEGNFEIVSQHVNYRKNTGLLNFGIRQCLRPGSDEDVLLNVTFNDTVYAFSHDGLKAKYWLDYSDLSIPANKFETSSFAELSEMYRKSEYPSTDYIWELNSFLTTFSSYGGKFTRCFFDKNTRQTHCLTDSDFLQSAGAFSVPPIGVSGEALIYVMEPKEVFDLKSSILRRIEKLYPNATETDILTIIDTFYVQKEKYEFLKLTEGAITEDSNPVLVFTTPNLNLK